METTAARHPDEDAQELRLALVMTGGVSLAVWIGGVTHEINRLRRRTQLVYGDLLDLTRTEARVDVIAGTSAGGLNGALLGMAIAHDVDLGGLRDLWLDRGALVTLFRSPLDRAPKSLMRGDDYFLPALEQAIESLERPTPERRVPTDPRELPVHLVLTASLLDGRYRGVPDDFGSIVHDLDHRAEFTFRRGATAHHAGDCIHPDAVQLEDDFADPLTAKRLALAARSTASFPFAFEPSFCPVRATTESPPRPDMRCHANFDHSRFTVDGGVLVNKPLRPALRAIFAQPASRQVRRVLAYVVPDPGEVVREAADEPDQVPTLTEVALDSLVTLPRNESVSSDLDDLADHNRRVTAQRRRREALLRTDVEVEALARHLFPVYRRTWAERRADTILAAVVDGIADAEAPAVDETKSEPGNRRAGAADAPMWDRGTLRSALSRSLEGLLPERFPDRGDDVAACFRDLESVEYAGTVALDLFRRGLGVTCPDPSTGPLREALRGSRGELHQVLDRGREVRRRADGMSREDLAASALTALGDDKVGSWAERAVGDHLPDQGELRSLAGQLAALIRGTAPQLRRCAGEARPTEGGEAATLEGLVAGLTAAQLPGAGPGETVEQTVSEEEVLRRLLALEVVQRTVAEEETVEQLVELVQVSADSANGFDDRDRAKEKLAGLQLGHFGAFYKRSWRANDWMWGRLDGAQRLAQVLVEPWRLRQLRMGTAEAADRIERIALGEPGSDEERLLSDRALARHWDRGAAERELAFLDAEDLPLPKSLPTCAQAVARRLQLDILREELPEVGAALIADRDDGARLTPEAAEFLRLLDECCPPEGGGRRPPSPAQAVKLLRKCKLGRETAAEDTYSDLFAQTVSTAAAVSASAVSATAAALPRLGKLLAPVRGVALALWILVQSALARSRAGAVLVGAVIGAGAALLAVAFTVDPPSIVAVLGTVLVLAGFLLAALRGRLKWAGLAALLAAMIALPAFILGAGEGLVDTLVVVGLVAGALVLGLAGIRFDDGRWRENARRADGGRGGAGGRRS